MFCILWFEIFVGLPSTRVSPDLSQFKEIRGASRRGFICSHALKSWAARNTRILPAHRDQSMTLLTVFLTQDCLKIGHANSGTKRDDDAELRNLNSYYNYYTSRVILVLLDHDEKREKCTFVVLQPGIVHGTGCQILEMATLDLYQRNGGLRQQVFGV